MADITITRGHHFSEKQVEKKIKQLAEQLVRKHGGSYRKEGNSLHYSTIGVDASVTHDDEQVTIEVELGFLLKGLKGRLSEEIENYMDNMV